MFQLHEFDASLRFTIILLFAIAKPCKAQESAAGSVLSTLTSDAFIRTYPHLLCQPGMLALQFGDFAQLNLQVCYSPRQAMTTLTRTASHSKCSRGDEHGISAALGPLWAVWEKCPTRC